MTNPFDNIYEIDAHHAAVLAEAFVQAYDAGEFWAILRFACRRDGKSDGFYQAYLDGKHFDEFMDVTAGRFRPEAFETLKDLAYDYREACEYDPVFYKLEV